jgi:two-component sensor histidine kinase/PAS domain-containing protein
VVPVDAVLAEHGLAGADADHLHRLIADWQLLADLSFADLLLAVAEQGAPAGERFVVVAQMRPLTGPTAHQDDLVGRRLTAGHRPQLAAALREGRIVREGDPVWVNGVPVREEALPVIRQGRTIAVVARDTNLAAARTPSRLELAYLRSADDLAVMLAEGVWPEPSDPTPADGAGPRVGDGLIRLDADGTVNFVSPNALSAYRRLGHPGDLSGLPLAEVTAALARPASAPTDRPAAAIATGRTAGSVDVEARGDGAPTAVVQLRSIPLRIDGRHTGAVVLVRDVTELRRRERLLLSKDATIREIHHRVKNNLQTVAALLRLQSRRVAAPEARAALDESVRRISSIAVVHETLSGSLDEYVDFDAVADRILGMVAEVAGEGRVRLRRTGSFGTLPAEVATPLALVVTELVHNAVEHGYPAPLTGVVDLVAGWEPVEGSAGRLEVTVADTGRGLPDGFDPAESDRLGLQIVRTLAESELSGRLDIDRRPAGGTIARLRLPAAAATTTTR